MLCFVVLVVVVSVGFFHEKRVFLRSEFSLPEKVFQMVFIPNNLVPVAKGWIQAWSNGLQPTGELRLLEKILSPLHWPSQFCPFSVVCVCRFVHARTRLK